MLISVKQLRVWLKDSAKTLREGGAEASAEVYEEIEARLAVEGQEIREECDRQVKEAQGRLSMTINYMLETRGLKVVPSDWREQ